MDNKIDNQNGMPLPPMGAQTISGQFDDTIFDDTQRYAEPPFLFEYRGVGFSPLGGIQALSGQKKNGKSILVSLLIGCTLCSDNEGNRFHTRFPGLRLRQSTIQKLGHAPRILYVDTEQEKENTDKVLERAKWLAELPSHVHEQRLLTQWLRVVPKEVEDSVDYRRKAILHAILSFHPDLVFIDGIRDIIHDFNDITESSELINQLMSIATKNNMCIWCTLHMNPRPQNDDQDGKMRGHLGTELGNKASDVFVMRKAKNKATHEVTFTMRQLDARGKDVDDLELLLNDDAGPILGAPIAKDVADAADAGANGGTTDNLDTDAGIINLFRQMAWRREGLKWGELQAEFEKQGIALHSTMTKLIDKAMNMGILEHKNRKPYFFNKRVADGYFTDPLGGGQDDGKDKDKAPF